MKTLNRRTFLKSTALGAAALSLPARSWAAVPGANDAIRVAVVGFRGRGEDHISRMRGLKEKGACVVALCDVDRKVLDAGVEAFAKREEKVDAYTDIREMLENKNIDVVTIATPNHWHALAAIWAVQAGKDVYVEKPVSHNVWEGRKIVEAARKYGKIVQAGTQSRSSHAIKEAVEWVRAGNLGKIRVARGLCYKPRTSIGKVDGPQPPPPEVDYNLWCGPAPMAPIRRKQFHYDWHWIWHYGNGDLGNQGAHQLHSARLALGVKYPTQISSMGGHFLFDDDQETPNTQVATFEFQDGGKKKLLVFEVRHWLTNNEAGIGERDSEIDTLKAQIFTAEGPHTLRSAARIEVCWAARGRMVMPCSRVTITRSQPRCASIVLTGA